MSAPIHQRTALVRYRSAPSSLLASFADSLDWDHLSASSLSSLAQVDSATIANKLGAVSESTVSSMDLPSSTTDSFASYAQQDLFSLPESPTLWPPSQLFSDMDGDCGNVQQDRPGLTIKGSLSEAATTTENRPASLMHEADYDVGGYTILESSLEDSLDVDDVASSTSAVGWKHGLQPERFPSGRNQAQGSASPILRTSSLPAPSRPRPVVGFENASSQYLGPCQTRAKRGCATHPRSIAERVRRTRISEKMRKLQELVPNMDKQLNTAEMLDEAVEYVKFLQQQVKELSQNCSVCPANRAGICESQ